MRHIVRLVLDSFVIKSETNPVPPTPAKMLCHTLANKRVAQHPTQKPSVPALPSSPILYSNSKRPIPFSLASSFRDAVLTDGIDVGGGRKALTSGRQTVSRDRLHNTNTHQTSERGISITIGKTIFLSLYK